MEELVLRAASVEEGEVARALRWGSWTQLSPVVADYGIVRIDAVGVGSCTVDDLPIDPRAPPEPVHACRTELWMLSCGD